MTAPLAEQLGAAWGGYIAVPRVLMAARLSYERDGKRREVNPTSKLVAIELLDWLRLPAIYPSHATLAERVGLSERTVRRALDELERAGVLRRTRRHGPKGARLPDLLDVSALVCTLNDLAAKLAATKPPDDVPSGQVGQAPPDKLAASPPDKLAGEVEVEELELEEVDTHTACARDLARQVLEEFNRTAQSTYADRKWLAMVEARCREHPDLGLAEHAAVIARNFAVPWWGDSPSPLVLYRDAAAFEQAMRATGRPRLPAKEQRVADRNRERGFVIEAYERAKHADVIEGTAVEVPNGNGEVPNGDGEVDLDSLSRVAPAGLGALSPYHVALYAQRARNGVLQ